MKSKVKLSAFCTIITFVVLASLMTGIVLSWGKGDEFYILTAVFIGMIISGLYYYPTSIEATDKSVIINRPLRTKVIPYSAISSADRCWPSAGGLRLCGSGGFMGYWGYFSDIVIGTFFGYYGDRNQCILLKLKDGKQYVVSCINPDEMTSVIQHNL